MLRSNLPVPGIDGHREGFLGLEHAEADLKDTKRDYDCQNYDQDAGENRFSA
jgi:hypothetical protein